MPRQSNRTARIEARISPDALAVVKRAAEIQGRSVSEFIRFADDECLECVFRVELVLDVVEIEPGLAHRRRGRRRWRRGFVLGADVFDLVIRHAGFMEDGFDDFTVRLRQNLSEDG